jgi:heme exporter protein C
MSESTQADHRSQVDWLLIVAVLAVAATFVRVIFFTPLEALQGAAQKIFYLHAPSAFAGLYLGFALVGIASAIYLWLRDERLDRVAASSAEIGVIFMTVTLITGPLWGKPIWGAYWTWDAKLTLTLFTWFLFLGYLLLRSTIDDRAMRARYSAVLGVLGTLLLPFIHLSVYLFRTLHPMPIVLKPGRPSLPDSMMATFALSMVSFSLLYVALLRARYRLAVIADSLDAEESAAPASVSTLPAGAIRNA